MALLRGINVGGKNKLPMRALVAVFEEAGCSDVRTHGQSGNVIFRASAGVLRGLSSEVSASIEAKFGYTVPIVLRARQDLAAVAGANPFLIKGADSATLHVAFLSGKPAPGPVSSLDENRSPPDEFIVKDAHIYLCCPNGVSRTKLTNQYFDSRLSVTCTMRNWKTVQKLIELCGG